MECYDHGQDELGYRLEDPIYCEATCPPENILYEGSDDEDYESPTDRRERYEAAAQRYLDGMLPFLLTASLNGPFDAASGWTNPWRSKGRTAKAPQGPGILSGQQKQVKIENQTGFIAETTQVENNDSLECHLPSPESLKYAPGSGQQHPYLEGDELAMVQNWRSSVRPNTPSTDSFWTSAPRESESARKRKARGSGWLRKLASKRRRTDIMEIGAIDTPIRQQTEAESSHQVAGQRGCDATSSLSSLPSSSIQSLPRLQSSNPSIGAGGLKNDDQLMHSASKTSKLADSPSLVALEQDIEMPDHDGDTNSRHDAPPGYQSEVPVTVSSPVPKERYQLKSPQRSPLPIRSPLHVQETSPSKSNRSTECTETPTVVLDLTIFQDDSPGEAGTSPRLETQQDQSFCFKMKKPRAQSEDQSRPPPTTNHTTDGPGADATAGEDDSWSGLSSPRDTGYATVAEHLSAKTANLGRPDASRTSTESDEDDTSSCNLSSISSQEFEGFESPKEAFGAQEDDDLEGSLRHVPEAIAYQGLDVCEEPGTSCPLVELELVEATRISSSESGHDDVIASNPNRSSSQQQGSEDERQIRCSSNFSTLSYMSEREVEGLVATQSSHSLPHEVHSQSDANERSSLPTGTLASVQSTPSSSALSAPSRPILTISASRSTSRSGSMLASRSPSRSVPLQPVSEPVARMQHVHSDDISTASEGDTSEDEPSLESTCELGDPRDPEKTPQGDQNTQEEQSQQASPLGDARNSGVDQAVRDTSNSPSAETAPPPSGREGDNEEMIKGANEEAAVGEDTSNSNTVPQQSPWAPSNIPQLAQSAILRLSQSEGEPIKPATPGKTNRCPDVVSTEAQTPWAHNTLSLPVLPGLRPSVSRSQDQVLSSGGIFPSSAVSVLQTPLQNHSLLETPSMAPRASTPEPQFTVKSFASFMSPSPERQPRQQHRAFWRDSGSRLPSTQGILASATKNPWAFSENRRVSWAPLPNEGGNVAMDDNLQTPSQSKSRPTSPPPSTPTADLPTSKESKFHHHFSAIARRNNSLRQRLLPPESQRTLGSPETQAMAEKFLAVDEVTRDPIERLQKAEEAQTLPKSKLTNSQEGPMDIIEDVFREMSDYLETWNVDAELEQARKDTSVQAPRVDSTVQSPW